MKTLQSYQPYHHEKWRGLVHADWAQSLAGRDPLAWMAGHPHELCRERASRQLYRVKPDDQLMYLKLMVALNEKMAEGRAGFVSGMIDKLKWQLRPSRALATLRIHVALMHEGFDCPLPILATREHRGSASREVLLCAAVEQPGLGELLAATANEKQVVHILQKAAAHIARFHQARFVHGDMLPNNLHVNEDVSRMWFMDNDRTIRRRTKLSWFTIQRNLAQITYRMLYHQKEDATRAFLHAYCDAAAWSRELAQQRVDRLIAQAKARTERDDPASRPPQPNKPSAL